MSDDLSQRVVEHRDAIYRYVLGVMRDPATAEDLTQETLLRAHDKRETLQDSARLVPWLYRIATNLCRDRFRAAVHRHRPQSLDRPAESADDVTLADTVEDGAPRLDDLMERKEMSACVQRYVSALPDTYRAVILLHDTQGLTNPEIAEMLGVSLPTVKIRLHRARERLRAALNDACSFSTDERGVVVCDPRPDRSEN